MKGLYISKQSSNAENEIKTLNVELISNKWKTNLWHGLLEIKHTAAALTHKQFDADV